MAFPTSSAQQAETNRKILEEIQTKKQMLIGLGNPTNQVNIEYLGILLENQLMLIFLMLSNADARTAVAWPADSDSGVPAERERCPKRWRRSRRTKICI